MDLTKFQLRFTTIVLKCIYLLKTNNVFYKDSSFGWYLLQKPKFDVPGDGWPNDAPHIRGYHFFRNGGGGSPKYTGGNKFLERKVGGHYRIFDDQNVGEGTR